MERGNGTDICISIIETHHKTAVVIISFLVTFSGWWAWNAFLAGVYQPYPSPYAVRGSFTQTFGKDPIWWLTLLLVFAVLVVMEIAYKSIKRNLAVAGVWRDWNPWPKVRGREHPRNGTGAFVLETWQEMEQNPEIRQRLRELAHGDAQSAVADQSDDMPVRNADDTYT